MKRAAQGREHALLCFPFSVSLEHVSKHTAVGPGRMSGEGRALPREGQMSEVMLFWRTRLPRLPPYLRHYQVVRIKYVLWVAHHPALRKIQKSTCSWDTASSIAGSPARPWGESTTQGEKPQQGCEWGLEVKFTPTIVTLSVTGLGLQGFWGTCQSSISWAGWCSRALVLYSLIRYEHVWIR